MGENGSNARGERIDAMEMQVVSLGPAQAAPHKKRGAPRKNQMLRFDEAPAGTLGTICAENCTIVLIGLRRAMPSPAPDLLYSLPWYRYT
jgi:hypothetical protein